MLLLRAALAVLTLLLGLVVVIRMLALLPGAGLTIVPGIVLGAAMIALGVHRLSLIARVRGTP
ncbi:MAG: hypothetical protein WAK16_11270 [Candidatus Cybelea sp.]